MDSRPKVIRSETGGSIARSILLDDRLRQKCFQQDCFKLIPRKYPHAQRRSNETRLTNYTCCLILGKQFPSELAFTRNRLTLVAFYIQIEIPL